ncbi:morphogenetic protein [Yersinia enterocolitica]|nr:morphogenetic protein [Yersinia enterocolitica]EKN4826794.1 morphogenetic protein [Yersinia enterocolitica]
MNEKPILFNAEMVNAILSGRKTQTRRIISEKTLHLFDVAASAGECHPLELCDERSQSYYLEFCPLSKPGDQLWVRETFQGPLFDYEQMESYLEDSAKFESPEYCVYKADGNTAPEFVDADDNLHCKWRPSIHMPRWASRINLLITGVRVERLQSITLGDICKEIGCGLYDFRPATYGFQVWEELWKSIYGEESWEANPWVWVIEFERMEAK